jgi:hypothetical protein
MLQIYGKSLFLPNDEHGFCNGLSSCRHSRRRTSLTILLDNLTIICLRGCDFYRQEAAGRKKRKKRTVFHNHLAINVIQNFEFVSIIKRVSSAMKMARKCRPYQRFVFGISMVSAGHHGCFSLSSQ